MQVENNYFTKGKIRKGFEKQQKLIDLIVEKNGSTQNQCPKKKKLVSKYIFFPIFHV